jgi:hypothetical protein
MRSIDRKFWIALLGGVIAPLLLIVAVIMAM